MSNIQRLGKTAFWVFIISISTKVLALVREILVAKHFGASDVADSYFMAFSILGMFCLISNAMHGSLIPMFIQVRERGDREEKCYLQRLLTGILIGLLVITFLVFLFAPQLVAIFAKGFASEKKDLTIVLMRLGTAYIIMSGIYDFFGNYLISRERFIPESISGLLLNVAYLAYFFLLPENLLTIQTLMMMTVITMMIKAGILWFFSRMELGRIRLQSGFSSDVDVQETLKLAGPILMGSMTYHLNGMVDKFIASGLSPGKISAMNYASKITGMVTTLMVMVTIRMIFPSIVKTSIADDDWLEMSVRKGFSFLLYLCVPIVVGIVILRHPIIELLYQRGEFTALSTAITIPALSLYAFAILSYILSDFLIKIFYAKKNMSLPMYIGMASVGLNIVLDFILVIYFDYLGLIAATVLASFFRLMAYIFFLRRSYGIGLGKAMTVSIYKSITAAFGMGIIVFYLNSLMISLATDPVNKLLGLLFAILFGVIVYFILLVALRVDELNLLKQFFKKNNQ